MKKLLVLFLVGIVSYSVMNVSSGCKKPVDNVSINDTLPAMPGKLFINEIFSKSISGTVTDWAELYNSSDSTLTITSAFFVSDTIAIPNKFQITKTFYINPKSFLVIECDKSGVCNDAIRPSFGLSSTGDDFVVYDGTRVIDQITFPDMSIGDISYGRTVNGGPNFATFTVPTKGTSNN